MSRPSHPRGRGSARHAGRDAARGPSQRQLRVGEALRHALAEVLRENEIRDPDLEGVSVTITQVKPSPDMRYATVFCEPLGGENAKAIITAGVPAGRDGPSDHHEIYPRPALCRR